MEGFEGSSISVGIENKALEMENDETAQSATETRPFTPPVPSEKYQFIPEIVPECPHLPNERCQHLPEMMASDHVSSGKKFGEGFKEIEIFSQMKKKAANRVHPIDAVIESQSIHFIRETKDEVQATASLFEIPKDPKDPKEPKHLQTVEEYDKLFKTGKKKRKKNKKDDANMDGLVLKKKRNRSHSNVSEAENNSKKYGVTMAVKSGVTRTPWHQTNGSSGEGSSKEGSGSSTRMKRNVTDETIVPSTSTSANSFLSAKPENIESNIIKEEEIEVDEVSPKRPIPTISQLAEKKVKVNITPVSIATYQNIQKEGVMKRGNCIICTTASVTFLVTVVLTIAILIAPKSLSATSDSLPSPLTSHVTSANNELPPKTSRKTGELTRNRIAVNISYLELIENNSNYTIAPINITEIIPNR